MKKKESFLKKIIQKIPEYFFICFLAMLLIMSIAGGYDYLAKCCDWPRLSIFVEGERRHDSLREFDKVYSFEGLKIYVYRDTGVMYCGSSEDGITVMLNTDGSPMIWKEGN